MSDADWASCIRTRRSFTGSLIKLAGAAVAYKTTQFQDTMATSSTESEFLLRNFFDSRNLSIFVNSR